MNPFARPEHARPVTMPGPERNGAAVGNAIEDDPDREELLLCELSEIHGAQDGNGKPVREKRNGVLRIENVREIVVDLALYQIAMHGVIPLLPWTFRVI